MLVKCALPIITKNLVNLIFWLKLKKKSKALVMYYEVNVNTYFKTITMV